MRRLCIDPYVPNPTQNPRMSCHNGTCACHLQAPPVRACESRGAYFRHSRLPQRVTISPPQPITVGIEAALDSTPWSPKPRPPRRHTPCHACHVPPLIPRMKSVAHASFPHRRPTTSKMMSLYSSSSVPTPDTTAHARAPRRVCFRRSRSKRVTPLPTVGGGTLVALGRSLRE